MTMAARPSRNSDSAPTTPALRLHDPRLSQALSGLRLDEPARLRHPDINAWLQGRDLLCLPAGNRSPGYVRAKRIVDVVGALLLLAMLSPLLVAVLAALAVTTRGRPIFKQLRVGHCGRLFQLYKFRTMRPKSAKEQGAVANEQSGPIFKNRRDPRITRIGFVLRKLSIDELPQLINVLRGEMSLVGPRPAVPAEVAQYKTWHFQRLAVLPGLTCLWQVSGRCEIREFDDWARLDLWYVQNQKLSTDFALLARTPWSVLSCRGAY